MLQKVNPLLYQFYPGGNGLGLVCNSSVHRRPLEMNMHTTGARAGLQAKRTPWHKTKKRVRGNHNWQCGSWKWHWLNKATTLFVYFVFNEGSAKSGILDVFQDNYPMNDVSPSYDNSDLLSAWDVRFYDLDNPVRQSVMETSRLASLVSNLSFTGLLGTGLLASAIQPENSIVLPALGAALLIPTAKAIQNWCRERRRPENPEPIGAVLKTAARRMSWDRPFLTVIGVAAIATTMLAVHVASPDYNYGYLKDSTSITRLAEKGANNKLFNKDNPLESAAQTIKSLSSSNRTGAQEKAETLKKASLDYLRASLANKNSAEYKKIFSVEESATIGGTPYLKDALPSSVTAQYTAQALFTVANAARTTSKEVSRDMKGYYVYSLIQLCRYANNPETKQVVNQSWKAMAAKIVVHTSNNKTSRTSFQTDIQGTVAATCYDNSFMPP